MSEPVHGGVHAIHSAMHGGARALFTLSGAHIFPLYDAAVGGHASVRTGTPGPITLIDVRHEQTAVFAAEGIGRLTRLPGFAAVTAGPGVTNVVSALTSACLNAAPLVTIGGRAPDYRWGAGALQELDHPAVLTGVTKSASTVHSVAAIAPAVAAAFAMANRPRRGPVFVDIPMDVLFSLDSLIPAQQVSMGESTDPAFRDEAGLASAAVMIAAAEHPVVVLGSDVWQAHAEDAARDLVHRTGIPAIANGMGRGVLTPADPLLVTRARSAAFAEADCVIVIGTPVDFRLNYGTFGPTDAPAALVHLVDAPDLTADETGAKGLHTDATVPGATVPGATVPGATVPGATRVDMTSPAHPGQVTLHGPLPALCRHLAAAITAQPAFCRRARPTPWAIHLADATANMRQRDQVLLTAQSDPIHPARIIGELLPRLPDDAIVIGDGGDFVSFAGKFIEPPSPGRWLDPGPFGCLGSGPGYALAARIAHPTAVVVLLLGDGAAGFSVMDWQTLIRHGGPTVLVVGNNSAWGLEKHPMRMLYGYDVLADLPDADYAGIFTALGGSGVTIRDHRRISPALEEALARGAPSLLDIRTDPEAAYPRSTYGV